MNHEQIIKGSCACFSDNPKRMVDILWSVQNQLGWISTESIELIAKQTEVCRADVESVVNFYSFFHQEPQGKFVIYLCNDIIGHQAGMMKVEATIKETLNIEAGETTADGLFSFHYTSCLGMSDQAPAALINNVVVSKLSSTKIKRILQTLKKHGCVNSLFKGTTPSYLDFIHKMVNSNIRKAGPLLIDGHMTESGLQNALNLYPNEIIEILQKSNLRDRDNAGMSTASKWQHTKNTEAIESYIICNAKEDGPGTFKDRVLLTERANLLFEGMTIAAYTIGSTQGILYLRAEYRYLLPHLEQTLEQRRHKGLLGQAISFNPETKEIFHFDIQIQLGASSYSFGEESSSISSSTDEKDGLINSSPFPAQVDYLNWPNVVNNVETFCNVPLILENGVAWFQALGTEESKGTKLLSICGDCSKPGVYEFPFGVSVHEVLKAAEVIDAAAVQVGSMNGELIERVDFNRTLCFEDLTTTGAIIIFSEERDLSEITDYFQKKVKISTSPHPILEPYL